MTATSASACASSVAGPAHGELGLGERLLAPLVAEPLGTRWRAPARACKAPATGRKSRSGNRRFSWRLQSRSAASSAAFAAAELGEPPSPTRG